MGFGRRPGWRGRRQREGCVPAVAVAFGVGLVLALCCSLKLALFLAAVLLIYLGVTCR